jgi:hypothetical protein
MHYRLLPGSEMFSPTKERTADSYASWPRSMELGSGSAVFLRYRMLHAKKCAQDRSGGVYLCDRLAMAGASSAWRESPIRVTEHG